MNVMAERPLGYLTRWFSSRGSRPLRRPRARSGPTYPTPNVPQNADGTPNMKAPTPRAADGHPDLTGLWEIYFELDRGGSAARPAEPVAVAAGSKRRRRARSARPHAERRRRPTRTRRRVPRSSTSARTFQGGASVSAWAKELRAAAHGRQPEGQSRRALSADGLHAAAWPPAAAQDRADAGR